MEFPIQNMQHIWFQLSGWWESPSSMVYHWCSSDRLSSRTFNDFSQRRNHVCCNLCYLWVIFIIIIFRSMTEWVHKPEFFHYRWNGWLLVWRPLPLLAYTNKQPSDATYNHNPAVSLKKYRATVDWTRLASIGSCQDETCEMRWCKLTSLQEEFG